MSLFDLKIDESARIKCINTDESIKKRLFDIGLIENTKVKCLLKSLPGDPKAYLIRGTVIAIRKDDAQKIEVELL